MRLELPRRSLPEGTVEHTEHPGMQELLLVVQYSTISAPWRKQPQQDHTTRSNASCQANLGSGHKLPQTATPGQAVCTRS